MHVRNRQWLLRTRPTGGVSADNFQYAEVEQGEPELRAGEILVRNVAFALVPTMRNWMNEPGRSYREAIELGAADKILPLEMLASQIIHEGRRAHDAAQEDNGGEKEYDQPVKTALTACAC